MTKRKLGYGDDYYELEETPQVINDYISLSIQLHSCCPQTVSKFPNTLCKNAVH